MSKRTILPSGLSNVHQLDQKIHLEYANGEKGSSIVKEGTLLLNGKKLQALVSDDLVEGLLSTSQLDRELNAATVQSEGKSVSFIPNERQQQILSMLFNEMDKDDVIAEAELNEDGLYEVQVSKQSAKAYSVSVFPRVSTDSLSQAVYLLHASLSHMPKEAMIRLAESASEECRDTDSLHPMVLHWPPAITGKVIRAHWTSCKACLLAQQKRVEFFTSHSGKSKSIENKSSTLRVEKHTVPGELGQVDMWGPYPAGRSGCTHLFTLIDSYSQYAVSLPCVNRSGEIPKLLKQVLGIFLSLGVRFRMIVGDSAFNTESCKHVFHHAYGESRGIQFSLAVPDEHQTCGIIERFFMSVQRRASANMLCFLENDPTLIQFLGLDAMVYASNGLNWTPRKKFDSRSSPASILKLDPLDFSKHLLLPFGIPAVAHQRKVRTKLHGHASEAIFIGQSENSSHRSGIFLNRNTRDTIVRRSFSVWNERPFYDFLVSEDTTPMVQFIESDDNDSNNDSDLPDLVADVSNSDSQELVQEDDLVSSLEVDSNAYVWTPVKITSLSRSKRTLVKNMVSTNFLEYDESSSPPVVQYIWKVDGLSRRPECDSLYVRYWDASLPRPRDANSFEYTLLSQFLSWAKPEGVISDENSIIADDTSRSEGVVRGEEISHSEDTIIEEDLDFARSEGATTAHSSNSEGDNGTSFNVVSPHRRRSSRLIGSSTSVPIKAAVMQYERLLHVMHRDLPIRLTRDVSKEDVPEGIKINSIYGLINIGFKRLETDSSIYYLSDSQGHVVYLTSHVDDLLMLSPNIEDNRFVYQKLSEYYTMTFDEVAREYLGYTFTRDRPRRILKLDQFGTVSKLLHSFPPVRSSKIPKAPYLRRGMNFTEVEESLLSTEDKSKFQQITGSLLYLAICTRGDLLYAVHLLTRRMSNPRVLDLHRAKRVLSYLLNTAQYGVTFHGNDDDQIFGKAEIGCMPTYSYEAHGCRCFYQGPAGRGFRRSF